MSPWSSKGFMVMIQDGSEVSAYADEVVDFVGYRYLDPQSTTWIWKEELLRARSLE